MLILEAAAGPSRHQEWARPANRLATFAGPEVCRSQLEAAHQERR